MSENMSQNTENDLVDQTFQELDSAVSIDDGDQGGSAEQQGQTGEKKKSNVLTYAIGGGAIVAVGAVAYFMLMGGQPQQQQPMAEVPAQTQIAEVAVVPEVAPTPTPVMPEPVAVVPEVAPTPVMPEPVVVAEIAPTPAPVTHQDLSPLVMPEVIPELALPTEAPSSVITSTPVLTTEVVSAPVVAEIAPVAEVVPQEINDLLASAVVEVAPAEVAPIKPVVVEAPVVETSLIAEVVAPVEKAPEVVIASNISQTASVNELMSLFDKHSVEIDKLDIRLTSLENRYNADYKAQQSWNTKIEERLAKLEKGAPVKSSAVKSSSAKSSDGSIKTEQRKRVKKASSSKPAVVINNKPEASNLQSVTLIDKREVAPKPKVEAVEVHSVFSGRLWIKKANGELDTFVVGEKLPTTEIIERIDEGGRKIFTSKRVISY